MNGAHFLLELPHCNTENFEAFLEEFSKMDEEEFNIVLLDNAAFHKAKSLKCPPNIHLLFLPPYAPELNPAEKVWWRLKRELKNRLFQSLEELQQALTETIEKIITTNSIQQLCSYSYYQAVNMD